MNKPSSRRWFPLPIPSAMAIWWRNCSQYAILSSSPVPQEWGRQVVTKNIYSTYTLFQRLTRSKRMIILVVFLLLPQLFALYLNQWAIGLVPSKSVLHLLLFCHFQLYSGCRMQRSKKCVWFKTVGLKQRILKLWTIESMNQKARPCLSINVLDQSFKSVQTQQNLKRNEHS